MFIPYGKQYIDQDDITNVVDTLKADFITQGPKVAEFENAIADYHGCKYAVAFCNGTAALHAAYYVSTQFPFGKKEKTIDGLGSMFMCGKPSQGSYKKFCEQYWEYVTVPLTFAASANGGLYCGGTPKFVDIDISTFCININELENAISDDTRVVTPVSYAGYPVDIHAIRELKKVKENNICIIHDACHAIGAKRNGMGIADFADMTILSFHPVKHITTGEGGMVLTNDKRYYRKLLHFRNHGITKEPELFVNKQQGPWYYEMQELGYNYRISDFQCALGLSQLKKLDKFLSKRNEIAAEYRRCLSDVSWITLPPGFAWNEMGNDNLHSYHLFVILLREDIDRKKFFCFMREQGIGVQVHYIPVHKLNYYKHLKVQNLLETENFYQRCVTLPIYYELHVQEINKIVDCLLRFKF